MAYGNRALKNPGAWYRANQIIRNNADLKAKVNADAEIQAQTAQQLTIYKEISTALGFLPDGTEYNVATAKLTAFPITKQMWMGYLPVSVYSTNPATEGEDQYRTPFAECAAKIRKRFAGIVKAWRLLADGFNTTDEGNPGGQV